MKSQWNDQEAMDLEHNRQIDLQIKKFPLQIENLRKRKNHNTEKIPINELKFQMVTCIEYGNKKWIMDSYMTDQPAQIQNN